MSDVAAIAGQLLYQDSCGMEVVLHRDAASLRIVMPRPEQSFNAAHLASLISALSMAHRELTQESS